MSYKLSVGQMENQRKNILCRQIYTDEKGPGMLGEIAIKWKRWEQRFKMGDL